MNVPKSVVKIKRNGVEYTSNVDYALYNIFELTRAAMRDVGRFLTSRMNAEARKLPGSQQDKDVKKYTAQFRYKVPFNPDDLPFVEVGVQDNKSSWYTDEHELGSSKQPRRGIMNDTAHANVAQIIEIESQYLSALEDEAEALRLIEEGAETEYSGGGDEW